MSEWWFPALMGVLTGLAVVPSQVHWYVKTRRWYSLGAALLAAAGVGWCFGIAWSLAVA